jgi:pyruvate dehydrogenase E1 component beta subunit
MAEIRFVDAIRDALSHEMVRDHSVCILGQDVSVGGPFGATAGLLEQFGTRRVLNTPISEGTVVGLATGAATLGLRPVVEVMFIDFITLAMDQLVNHAAKLHYMTGGQLRVPLTVRVLSGIGGGYGAHHSQSLEGWFLHVPGLKVVAPSTPADAYSLLVSAIRDDNPVLVIEHRGLYWSRGDAHDGSALPLGRAVIRRLGKDVTVLAWSKMVSVALQCAARLAADDIDVEVIDLRSLAPLDFETILASTRRTRRLLIAHEAVEQGGVSAEIAARVQQQVFEHLLAPVARIGAAFAPVPASLELEKSFVPGAEQITAAIAALARANTFVRN